MSYMRKPIFFKENKLIKAFMASIFYIIYLPFNTCTITVRGFAFEGLHVYFPESGARALCMSKYEVVMSPFSVMTLTPPLGES